MPELLSGRNAPRPKRGRKDAGQRPEAADLKGDFVNLYSPKIKMSRPLQERLPDISTDIND